jgi:succinate dehydrogenase / fumarate reductase, flavoprotein subunit
MAHTIQTHHYDILIIGTGGAGLMAALHASSTGKSVACVSKVFPTQSHTVAAQGGINAALGNLDDDKVEWHMYDTIQGSDWLADQDAVEYMCRQAPKAIQQLEKLGVPFSRHTSGQLDQRIYGGQSSHLGKGPSPHRACFAADRTGHAILHTLYQQCLKANVVFFNYHMAIDLLMAHGECYGVLAWDMEMGVIRIIQAQHVILATGGYGQIYDTTTSSSICTGDGTAMVARAGLPLQDMEFIQFHPTGIYGSGFLITEAARAEGAYLSNSKGERFMERYAPNYLDLAPRDVISRAIATELFEGKGCGPLKDHVLLHLEHLSPKKIHERLPEIATLAKTYAHIDITKTPVPVTPSVHYTMGGIPTTLHGQVITANGDTVPGLYAIGEAACISVHGANRLGCNSLLDLIVFGTATIQNMEVTGSKRTAPTTAIQPVLEKFTTLLATQPSHSRPASILRTHTQHLMSKHAGIFRTHTLLEEGLICMRELLDEAAHPHVQDHSLIWNNTLQEALEVQNMALLGYITLNASLHRTESRGAHYRSDYPTRDDNQWLNHSLSSFSALSTLKVKNRPVRMHLYTPQERKY